MKKELLKVRPLTMQTNAEGARQLDLNITEEAQIECSQNDSWACEINV